jgi:dihydroorotase
MTGQQVRVIDAIVGLESWDYISPNAEIEPQFTSSPLVLGNALVDMYSTSGAPGFEHRETIASLQAGAIAGGFAKVGILPHTDPPIDNLASAEFWAKQGAPFLPWGAVTRRLKGEQMADLGELAPLVVGFTDGKAIANLALVRRAMEYIKPLGKPLMLMPQNPDLARGGVAYESKLSVQCGLGGMPITAETSALAALIELVRLTQTPTHFMRLSTARSVQLIAQAKADGLPVTASVAWSHLCLSEQYLPSYNTNLKFVPPLPSEADRLALIQGVKTGVIDAIAIDHTPYTYEEKMVGFELAPPGAIGLELALAVLWHELVETHQLTALELWQALSSKPARCLGIAPPQQKIWFAPYTPWTANCLASLSRNSFYCGQTLKGKVVSVQYSSTPNL